VSELALSAIGKRHVCSVFSMENVDLTIHECGNDDDAEAAQKAVVAIYSGLGENIMEKTGFQELATPIRIVARNSDAKVIGGVIGDAFGGWLHVELLWVEKSVRGRGLGTKLMQMAESRADELGCTSSYLNTYSFEARGFYEGLGYEVFATLEGYPRGHSKHFLRKKSLTKP
jgi:GNAT superfamily N-acetyltransferase